MYTFFLIIHIIVCILLVLIVLFQAGKSFGLSGLTGGGASDAIMTGVGENNLIKKVTLILAILFFVNSFILSYVVKKKPNQSLMNIMPPAPIVENNISEISSSTNSSTQTSSSTSTGSV